LNQEGAGEEEKSLSGQTHLTKKGKIGFYRGGGRGRGDTNVLKKRGGQTRGEVGG